MGTRNVMPPKELADQIWGPGFVLLDFEDDPVKYDCVVLGTPGADVMLIDAVWLTEEVGKPGEEVYRLKHFPPGQYTASFVDWDDVTGRPIFERAVAIRVSKPKQATKRPAAKTATPKKQAAKKATPRPTKKAAPKKQAAKKATPKKPATNKTTEKPTKKTTPKSTRKRGKQAGE